MKKSKLNIILSLSLLALMLVGRVGIHIFHQHDSFSTVESVTLKKSNSSTPILAAYQSEVDCALCKLDAFQEIAIATFFTFFFLLIFGKPLCLFLISELESFSFFTKSRGPPFIASIA